MFDTDPFFADFAEPYQVAGVIYQGIYVRNQVQSTDGYVMTSSFTHELTCQTEDVVAADVDQGTSVTIRGKSFSVYDLYDDSTGITTLYLHEVQS